ncbi:MAG TPA: YraN family protein [Bryobacteraceae bacterium]|jgi:putative endonuclease|nr:YraN family protein [Bryobacteraceae bacterium]
MASGGEKKRSGWLTESRQLLWRCADAARQRRERKVLNPDAALGRHGEDLAHRFLRSSGLTVVARNYRPGADSEIDLVARDGDILVFVEVKSRQTAEFGSPDRAVDLEKQRHIVRAARAFTARSGDDWSKVRFDVVSIVFSNPPAITHHRDSFFHGRALPQKAQPA